jgi:hypothetical protein
MDEVYERLILLGCYFMSIYYNFMLRVTCITARNGWNDRRNVSFESRNGLLHLLSFNMCSHVDFTSCRNRKFILVSYHEDYNFMLRVPFVTVSNG